MSEGGTHGEEERMVKKEKKEDAPSGGIVYLLLTSDWWRSLRIEGIMCLIKPTYGYLGVPEKLQSFIFIKEEKFYFHISWMKLSVSKFCWI